MQKNTITNIILGIIALALLVIIVILIQKKNESKQVVETETAEIQNSDTTPVNTVALELESDGGLVTPPAPGIFSANAVRNFTSEYNSATRMFTFTANVMRRFFFEGNAPVALFDQDGNLIEMKGVTTTGDLYAGQGENEFTVYGDGDTDFFPLTFTFVLPASESPTQQFVVRIMQDDPSGGEGGTPLYWGKVVSGK